MDEVTEHIFWILMGIILIGLGIVVCFGMVISMGVVR